MNQQLYKIIKGLTDRGLKIIPQSYQRPLFKWREDTEHHYDSDNITNIKVLFGYECERDGKKLKFDSFGVDCERSEILVIDRDDMSKSMRVLAQHSNELSNTLTITSGSGKGAHHYFKIDYPNEFKTVVIAKYGFDIKAAGGLITAPGSKHKSGGMYSISIDKPIQQMSVELRNTLLSLQKENVKKRRSAHVLTDTKTITKGERNEKLFSIGLNVCRKLGLDSIELLTNIMYAYNQRCEPPMDARTIQRLSERVFNFHMKTFNETNQVKIAEIADGATMYSDYSVLKTFTEYAGDKLFYSTSDMRFFVYNGKKWVVDESNETTNFVREILSMYWKRLEEIQQKQPDVYIMNKLDKVHSKLQTNAYFQSLSKIITSSPEISVSSKQLNKDKFLFNCDNGTLDLKTGELKKHTPYDYITKQSPVSIHSDKHYLHSRFFKFIKDIFLNDIALIEFVQKFLGYCMSGSTKEQKFCIFWGGGQNGKSTLINVIQHVMNDYMQRTPQDTFMATKGSKQTNDLASLFGSRLVVATETEKGKRIDETRIKEITGGDPITCRHLYGDFFTYKPEFKVIITTNNKPYLSDPSFALRRRMCLVPFAYQVAEKDKDENLEEHIITNESEMVLYWIEEGFRKYMADGLEVPQKINKETDAYFEQEDTIQQFVNDCIEEDKTNQVSAASLYQAFKNWAEENHEYVLTKRVFGERFTEKGFSKKRKSDGVYYQAVSVVKKFQPENVSIYSPDFQEVII